MTDLIHHYVDVWAERSPQNVAAAFVDERLSYTQLSRLSNQLAHILIGRGVSRWDRVGIYMDKSLYTPVAMYGIMKAGAAYVPLDPSAPPERTAGVIADCGITHVISARNKLARLHSLEQSGTVLNTVIGPTPEQASQRAAGATFSCIGWDEVMSSEFTALPPVKILSSDLAYIIYTSGSTGRPKGIMHTHASGLAFARWAASEYTLGADDRLSNHAPLHFDLSIFDFFAAAVSGARTVVIPEDYTKLPASYSQMLVDQGITVLFTVPFALVQLLLRGMLGQRDLSALRWVLFGGEPFAPRHLHDLMQALPGPRYDNMYGPAEVNGVTHHTLPGPPPDDQAIPIGPISQISECLIVDADNQPVAQGEIGELLVRSPTMMRGYWNRPDLNAKAFHRVQALPEYELVYYRTGDLVRDTGDGQLMFAGRKDRQIKVRGYRVELDEIETALLSNPQVEEGAVISVPDIEGSQQIRAFAILKGGAEADDRALMSHLKDRLPWYAAPAQVTLTENFPRTTTGKIDRTTLRAQTIEAMNG